MRTKALNSPVPHSVRAVSRTMTPTDRVYLPAMFAGFVATTRHFFLNLFRRAPLRSTVEYPDVKAVYPERFRGMHRLVPREDGAPRCVACYMCQTACPARCIHIVAGETPNVKIEKFPVVFEIDELRCVACGLCVEACPCDAIRMDTGIHPLPVREPGRADFQKNDLLGLFGRHEDAEMRKTARPPATAAGTGRVDRSHGDGGAGGASGGY